MVFWWKHIKNIEIWPKIIKVRIFEHYKLYIIPNSSSSSDKNHQNWRSIYFQKNFLPFGDVRCSPEDSETSFGPNHGFPRKFSGESRDFSKSHSLWEAVSSLLRVGFGCPDTLGLSTDSHSLISVAFDCARLAQTITILDTRIDFCENSYSPPHSDTVTKVDMKAWL